MGDNAVSCRAAGSRRGKAPHAVTAAAVAAVIVLTGTACSTASSSTPVSTAPAVTVLKHGANNGNGDIFITPGGGSVSGPEIISNTGKVIWFHPLPAHELAADFRTQTYQGKPVLTWWQGPPSLGAVSGGTDYIYNDRYQKIAEVKGGNGYTVDGQEFLITPWNTALITADTITTANLTSIGGPADQKVVDSIVQEIDISTGKVLFQWNAADHVPYQYSEQPRPASAATPWDWFYINAVHLDTDGNLLISARYAWAVYKVSLRTGNIIWVLGGKHSTFRLKAAPGQVLDSAGEIFAYQHDPEAIGNNEYTLFDDESGNGGSSYLLRYSRVVTVRLDLAAKVATLVKSVKQPEDLLATEEGNAQITRNGDLFISWGNLSYISEFSPTGQLLFNAQLPGVDITYRAYRLPWHSSQGLDKRPN
jgi:hypothetical protein